jgi:hypothetical protein
MCLKITPKNVGSVNDEYLLSFYGALNSEKMSKNSFKSHQKTSKRSISRYSKTERPTLKDIAKERSINDCLAMTQKK